MCKIVFTLIVLFAFYTSGQEIDGKFESSGYLMYNQDGSFDVDVSESADLELVVPGFWSHDLKIECILYKPLQAMFSKESMTLFMKKLYLMLRFKYLNIALGRQPMSWTFGSLFNPVDYTIGSVSLNEESNSKYTDAVSIYVPINWNSGVSAAASFPNGISLSKEKVKYGVRTRLGIIGYDITTGYVREAEKENSLTGLLDIYSILPQHRIFSAFKGDLWDLGIYGSLGYHFDEFTNGVNSVLLGADYSFNIVYDTKLILQAEYIGIETDFLETIIRTSFLKMNENEHRFDMASASANIQIDDFSSFTLFAIMNINDQSFIISPVYQNLLPLNIDARISAFIFLGKENTLFSPGGFFPLASGEIRFGYRF